MAASFLGIGRRRASIAGIAVLSGLLAVGAAPAAAATPAAATLIAPAPCADVTPLADVHAGQVGTGWTVVRGTEPKPFKVEILGIYPDGVAPGRDMIMVEVSDLPGHNVIGVANGIWSGMSGSPVYVNGDLVGAVAYGFSAGPNRIGGLSPAEDMAKLLYYPNPSAAAAARAGRTHLSGAVRRDLLRQPGVSSADVDSFDALPLPLAVSGLNAKARTALGKRLADDGIGVVVTRGATAAAPAGGSFATPVPGGNFAALISYGDVTIGGVGTTTWVCGSRALAFGHPLALTGPSSFGASGGRSLAIVDDPTLSPFKLAVIGRPFGTVDQDRLSGIRSLLGSSPDLIPITARVRDLDLGQVRDGRTDVTSSDWVNYVAPNHLYADLIAGTDREGPGTARLRITIDGKRANGTPFSVVSGDRLASTFSIQYEAAAALDTLVYRLAENGIEDVTFTGIRITTQVTEAQQVASLRRVLISRNGGEFLERSRIRVNAGDSLAIRATLREGTSLRTIERTLVVPDDASGFGQLTIAGGSELFDECDYDPSSCDIRSFRALLRAIEQAPRGDELVFDLTFDDFEGSSTTIGTKVRQPAVVTGYESIEVNIR